MTDRTWELIVQVEKPIPREDLETVVKEGTGLHFPIARSYEGNLVNDHWNQFLLDMALRRKDDIVAALERDDNDSFGRVTGFIGGISSMYRFNDASLSHNTLRLTLSVTDFKNYIGTKQNALVNPDFRRGLMEAGIADCGDPNHYFANPLASCANLVTSDGGIPIGMRSKNVAIYPEVPHLIGGYVKVNGANRPDFSVRDVEPLSNIMKELHQELGLLRKDIARIDFLGIARNITTRGPEMLYNVDLVVTSDELHQKWETQSRDRFEHRSVAFYSVDELPVFLEAHQGRMVPSGEAALTLFLQHYT